MSNSIFVEQKDGIKTISMDKPPLNIINIEMLKEMSVILEEVQKDDSLYALVITAKGRVFSAGVDIADHTGDKANEMIKYFHGIFKTMNNINIPILSVVNGSCLGGACEIVLFTDIILATENAKFGQPEIVVGVFPPIAAIILPDIIGMKNTFDFLLTGRVIDAKLAYEWRMVNKLIESAKISDEINFYANQFKKTSRSSLKLTKQAIKRTKDNFEIELKKVEDFYLNTLMKTSDAEEGLKAFLEKRTPRWQHK